MRGTENGSDAAAVDSSTSDFWDRSSPSQGGYRDEPSQNGNFESDGFSSGASSSILGTKFVFDTSDYRIDSRLGAGGFATTYLAKPPGPGEEPLVVKVPNDHVLLDPTWKKKFHRESRIAANRNHPNLVDFKGMIQLPGNKPAILQEYIEDSKELGKLPPKGPGAVGSILAQALYGLRALHKEIDGSRIVHRDISPQNVLVTESGLVKIIDFGLAKDEPRQLPQLTRTMDTFGTPGCIAPEQLTGAADVDERVDLFSLGKSMASWLQGRTPYHVEIHALEEPWRPLLAKLTAYCATDRYPSAEAGIRALLATFNDLGRTFESPVVHCDEFNQWESVPAEWIRMANAYVAELDDSSRIDFCTRLGPKIYTSDQFDIAEAFGLLDESIGLLFGDGNASFDACDPIGRVLARWYPHLRSLQLKLSCFRRIVTIAVEYHRYSVMGQVRKILASAADSEEKRRLQREIKELDPGGIIRLS